ncbi:hypothetical protein [Polaromonas sp. CG9_12]|nr:hypothetical protein [Polaromonas sp. CG9_12]
MGNHTRDHAILTNCTPAEMVDQITVCQNALADLVGYRPVAIAYPNGNCSPAAVHAAVAAGLRVGFTVAPRPPGCRWTAIPACCSAILFPWRAGHPSAMPPVWRPICSQSCAQDDDAVGLKSKRLHLAPPLLPGSKVVFGELAR